MAHASPPRSLASMLLAAGLVVGLALGLAVGPAGCDKSCEKFCSKMESCLSPKQKKKFFTSRAQCLKNCKDWKLEKTAKHCLAKAEGSCFRMLKCMGPAIRSAIRERHPRRGGRP